MRKLNRGLLYLVVLLLTINASGQVALDNITQTTDMMIYKTIVFANGHDSYDIVGPQNLNAGTSEFFGKAPIFFRQNASGGRDSVNMDGIGWGAVSYTDQETVGGVSLGGTGPNTHPRHDTEKYNVTMPPAGASNPLNLNNNDDFPRSLTRGLADTNNDGWYDAQLTRYEFPQGQALLQSMGFKLGDLMRVATPELVEEGTGNTLILNKQTWFELTNENNEWKWKKITTLPDGTVVDNIQPRVSGAMGVEDVNDISRDVTLYPNPVRDHFALTLPTGTMIDSYQIYTMNGQQIMDGKRLMNGDKVTVSSLPQGMYILVAKTQDGKSLKAKVIKQ